MLVSLNVVVNTSLITYQKVALFNRHVTVTVMSYLKSRFTFIN